ncbi:P-loop ATPase, Sll1717 family [Proteus mirabilis]|uniref:P-loop ATPase, Sll1717 family n=1 Tax=Proteus mirabilis TaxID=584 RepID=UPI003877F136
MSDMLTESGIDTFQNNENLSMFHTLMRSEKKEVNGKSCFSKLIPNIRKGNIEISKDPRLNLDFDWDNNGVAKIAFYKLIEKADSAFESLQPSKDSINIFFDELELNYTTKKQYQRDSRLLRDLIITIEKVNAICKRNGFNICLFAAIRSEVLNSVDSLGKEINKPLTDFGTDIVWNRAGVDSIQQPLLHIVEQRINNSREEFGLDVLNPAELWSTYFPKFIHNKKPQTYLLHNSWYRPRDIVRLLLSAQESYGEESAFSTQSLEAIRKRYYSACWVELTEELKAIYKSEEINGIKNILYGYTQVSTIQEISSHAESVAQSYPDTRKLLDKRLIAEILVDLYRIGVIGNYSNESQTGKKKFRFSFRGDDDILLHQKFYIHNALKAHLSID